MTASQTPAAQEPVLAEVEIRDEARVHLWYEAKFGTPCPPYTSAADAIDSFRRGIGPGTLRRRSQRSRGWTPRLASALV
jgi:hypothetical protein